jgi:hypothetical protein
MCAFLMCVRFYKIILFSIDLLMHSNSYYYGRKTWQQYHNYIVEYNTDIVRSHWKMHSDDNN